MLALHQLDGRVRLQGVRRPVIFIHLVINRILRLLRVQLARLAVQSGTVVIVDAVGDVGGLLDLRQEAAAADGMDAAGGQEEDVAGSDGMLRQHLGDAVFRHQADVVVGGDPLLQTGNQFCAGFGADHVPHLRLAAAAVALCGQLVVRMDLDAEVALRVDEFDQQREGPGIDVRDLLARFGAFSHDRFAARDTGEHPALRAPDQRLENRRELIHRIFRSAARPSSRPAAGYP